MEKTLVIFKPGTLQRGLVGEIITRFEKKGLQLCGMKMVQLNEEILNEHYAHLAGKPFFKRIIDSMMLTPVIVSCWKGLDAVRIVHHMAGTTNGRSAEQGTIRGDYSMSVQENIVHTSDTVKTANDELARFFKEDEIYDYLNNNLKCLYANDEI